MTTIKVWITAFRLRTLPLAFSSIFMGSFLAADKGYFNWLIFLLATGTTLFLQILSNLANDYGDTINGADHAGRQGPSRAVQSGAISLDQMKKAIFIFVLLSLVCGVALIYYAFGSVLRLKFILFFLLGLAAIVAALKYTMGSNPYGYRGLGDLYVLLFFGLAGVAGAYFLYGGDWDNWVLLPALSVGLLSTGVLNVNNLRDAESDRLAGKQTLVVKWGLKKAKLYHYALIVTALVLMAIFVIHRGAEWPNVTILLILPAMFIHLKTIKDAVTPKEFDPQLKVLSLSTLFLVLLFGWGLFIG